MKKMMKRILAFMLTFALIFGLFPPVELDLGDGLKINLNDLNLGLSTPAYAAGSFVDIVPGLDGSWTDASNSSGKASWSLSGNSITGSATGYKFIMWGQTVTTTLTLTNTLGTEATLKFNYVLTSGGSVSGAISGTSGSYDGVLAHGSSITITLTSPKGTSSNSLAITGISLESTATGDVTTTFKPGANGSYTVDGTALTATKEFTKGAAETYAVVATPASGHKFFGWYNETKGTYLSYTADTSLVLTEAATVYPVFIESTTALFGVGTEQYYDLNKAAAAASSGTDKTVVLLNSGTLTSDYTIPAGITLLIPSEYGNTPMGDEPIGVDSTSFVTPSAYRTLTLAKGVTLTINGTLEVASKFCTTNGGNVRGDAPSGKYGAIFMTSGSKIELNSGSTLYAWGYIYGNGAVNANSGANVYEFMQIADFYGGTQLADMKHMFPFSQYYVQNIEVPLTIYSGATEYIYVKLVISSYALPAAVAFIGAENSGAMFSMATGSSITKTYNPTQDRLIVDVNGDASMSSITVTPDLSAYNLIEQGIIKRFMPGGNESVDSAAYILCLNSNMTINFNSGTTSLNNQDISMLPGVEINVANGATIKIGSGDSSKTTVSGGSAGKNIYVYDKDQWGAYVFSGKQLIAAAYSPTTGRKVRAEADLKDVKIDVNGSIITDGFIYTTKSGAQIISSQGTGQIVLTNGAGAETNVYNLDGTGSAETTIAVTSAQLQNGDGSYTQTAGAAEGTTFNYCATHERWYSGEACSVTYTWSSDNTSCTAATTCGATATSTNVESNTTATCTAAGTTTYKATFPAIWATTQTKTVDTAALSHTWINADCDTPKTCSVCGATEGEAKGHTPGAAATCTTAQTCTVCSAVLEAAKGHNYGEWIAEVPATCEGTGTLGHYHCSVCNKNFDSQKAELEDLTIQALGHKDENKDHVCENGCGTAQGVHTDTDGADDHDHFCDYCGGTVEGETCNGGKDTCMAGAVCIECGATYGTKLDCEDSDDVDHNCDYCGKENITDHVYGTEWKTDETNHWHECACGAKSEEAAHSDETTKDHKCDTCGYEMSKCEDSDDADHKCDHCGQDDVTDHTWVEADCDTPKTCSVCGETEGEALGHTHQSYSYDDDQHWSICGVCGETFDKAAHTFGDDHKCDCGAQNFWVDCSENIQYSIYKGTVTVTHGLACKAGYLKDGKYVEILATANDDGSYSFSAPEGVTSIVIVVIGDVDQDGELSIDDKTMLDAYLADPENAPLNEIHKFAADVNGNGAINSVDRILLARAVMSTTNSIYKPFAWNTGEGA